MAITQIPGWSDNIGQDVPKSPLGIYKRVALVYKCANLVANSVATAPVYLYNKDNQIDWLYKQSLSSLMRRVAKDLQLYGKSYILKLLDGRGNVQGLRRLNPNFMQHDVIGIKDGYPIYRYTQRYNHRGKSETQYYEHHEVIYIPLDSENNDVDPDVYPAAVALSAGKVRAYMSAFGEKYFDKGGVGVTLLYVEGEPSDDEMGKFEKWIKRRLSGVANAFSILPLRKKVTATQLTPVAKDLAIGDLDDKTRKDILDAFGVPEGMVEKSANYASADVHNRQFWDMTIKPLVDMILDAFNMQLFGDSGVELRAALEELPVYQVDESRRSAALANMVNAGVSIEAAWWSLGYADLPDDIPLMASVTQAPEPQQPQQNQQVLDSGGATPGDDSTEEGQFKSIEGVAIRPSMFTHLDKWRTKCENQLRHKKSPNFSFESELIPVSMKAAIEGALSEVDDFDDIRHVFDTAVDLHHSHGYV